jgi:cytochrome c553
MSEGDRRIRVYVDGAGPPLADLPGSAGEVTLDTSRLTDGPHRLRIETLEEGRITGTREMTFTVRNGPGIAVGGLEDRDEVRGRLALTIGATEAGIGRRLNIASLELHRGLPFWVGGFALLVILLMAIYLAIDPLHYRQYGAESVAVRRLTAAAELAVPTNPPANPLQFALTAAPLLPVLDFDPGRGDAGHGATIYARSCAGCHGAKGEGRGDQSATLGEKGIYPRLAGQPAAYAYRQLYSFAHDWRQNDVMQTLSRGLSPQDWVDVAVYLERIQQTPFAPAVPAPANVLEFARSIDTLGRNERGVSRCESCHGPSGIGVAPHFPALIGQDARYIAAQIRDFADGRRRNDLLHLMQPVAHGLVPQEVEALGLYFQNQRPGASD